LRSEDQLQDGGFFVLSAVSDAQKLELDMRREDDL
jgi:hypothetical protein